MKCKGSSKSSHSETFCIRLAEKYKNIRTFVIDMQGLSILVPTYNDECLTLVRSLSDECRQADMPYEIIVGDDGSTDKDVVETNRGIDLEPNCRYIINNVNRGRAAIRNFLGRQAKYDWLLFIDSDMTVVDEKFIGKYADMAEKYVDNPTVIYGGYCVPEQSGLDSNLRYRYERSCRHEHTAEKRAERPYSDFHTSNFMIRRKDFLAHTLDENYRHYGYEDVAYGQTLRQAGIGIDHIDNPMGFCRFEDNAHFVAKTEEGLRTLAQFKDSLKDYSRLLQVVDMLRKLHAKGIASVLLRPLSLLLRHNLTGSNPSLTAFKVYKLSYLLQLI